MLCPHCKAALEDDAKFCGSCGKSLVQVPAAAARAKMPASPRERSMIGVVLNQRFEIKEKLGEGGFGAVYGGVQLSSGRNVAIKLLHPEMTRDENVVARFRREGQLLCTLKDVHTITTYDFDQTPDGTLYLAMERLEGRSLHDLFKAEAPLPWKRVFQIMAQMCSSLGEAHAQGIVHRDLKPENIYLENRSGTQDFVKILDFGIAKVLHGEGGGNAAPQLTATGQTLGTLEYMSPEQLMGKALDGRSDIYALGVLSFELLTGRLPFPEAKGPAALITAQLRQVPPAPSAVRAEQAIPKAVDFAVLRMLEKDKSKRFADVAEVRARLEKLIASDGEDVQETAFHPQAHETPIQRRPVPTPGAGMAALAPDSTQAATSRRKEWARMVMAGSGWAWW